MGNVCNTCLWNAHDNGLYTGYEPSAYYCAAGHWRTDEPYMNGVPFLATCSDGVVRIARYDQVLGKTGYWTLDRATIVPDIIAWAQINPYEGVE